MVDRNFLYIFFGSLCKPPLHWQHLTLIVVLFVGVTPLIFYLVLILSMIDLLVWVIAMQVLVATLIWLINPTICNRVISYQHLREATYHFWFHPISLALRYWIKFNFNNIATYVWNVFEGGL